MSKKLGNPWTKCPRSSEILGQNVLGARKSLDKNVQEARKSSENLLYNFLLKDPSFTKLSRIFSSEKSQDFYSLTFLRNPRIISELYPRISQDFPSFLYQTLWMSFKMFFNLMDVFKMFFLTLWMSLRCFFNLMDVFKTFFEPYGCL